MHPLWTALAYLAIALEAAALLALFWWLSTAGDPADHWSD